MSNRLIGRFLPKQDKVTRAVCLSLAVLFSLAYLTGKQVDVSARVFHAVTPFFVPAFFLFALLAYFLLTGLYALALRMEAFLWDRGTAVPRKRAGVALFLFLMLCWLPYFLIYFPGSMTYDSYYVTGQAVLGVPPSDWHPYTYVLLVRLILRFGMLFGGIRAGVAAYSLCQMAFLAGALAYGVLWLRKKNLKPYCAALIALFFALVPIFPVLAITMWKDIPFAACLLLYTLFLYDILERGGRPLARVPGALAWILLTLSIALLRHNGYFIVLPTTVLLAAVYRKRLIKMLPALLLPLLLVPLIQNLYYAGGVAKGPFSESLSIPAQQIARTVSDQGTITEDQREQLSLFFDVERLSGYDPFLADPVKNSFHKDYLEAHKTEFFRLWAELMASNQKTYCKAYIMSTLGYWMPGVCNWIVLPRAQEGKEIGVEQANLLQPITGDIWESMGSLYHCCSIGAMVWASAFLVGLTLIRRRGRDLLALTPIFILWLTILAATPVYCEFRYILALPLALPFAACMSLKPRDVGS